MVFREFSSMEEMWNFMAAAEAAAAERVTDEQRQISYGDHYLRFYDGMAIFSTCPSLPELERLERELGAEPDELGYSMAVISDAHERGYRYGQHYSVIEPDGEWGSAYISEIAMKLSAEQFAQARSFHWSFERLLDAGVDWAILAANKEIRRFF